MNTPAHPVRDLGSGRDLVRAFNERVTWSATCVPVFCDARYDTQLAVTYCHRMLDERTREPMVLNLALLGDTGTSRYFSMVLPFAHSEWISVKDLLGQERFRGACFVWSEKEDDAAFVIDDRRLAAVFFAYYVSAVGQIRADVVHASPGCCGYYRVRPLIVREDGNRVSAVVCAPVDAYRNHPSRLHYTFGLRHGEAEWQHRHVDVPFTPVVWLELGELFGVEFEAGTPYLFSAEGPKGKGWLMIETSNDFSFHHL